jgi:alkylhydroperoxidase family enzyme
MTDSPEPAGRIALLSEDEARARGKEIGVPSSMAHLNVFRALLNHPEMAKAVSGLLSMLLWKANLLDERLRELIIMRIGWRTGSLYEWTQHWNVARRIGMDEADILAVRDWRESPVLNAADRAVLAATDETLDDGRISDATWQQCRAHIDDDAALAEMVVAISNWRMFSEVLQSLQIPLEAGIAHWPPDGKAPPA